MPRDLAGWPGRTQGEDAGKGDDTEGVASVWVFCRMAGFARGCSGRGPGSGGRKVKIAVFLIRALGRVRATIRPRLVVVSNVVDRHWQGYLQQVATDKA